MSKFLHLVLLTTTLTLPGLAQQPAASPQPRAQYERAYENRVFKSAEGGELKYGWLTPLHAKTGEKYPLVICLHGVGGSARASAVLSAEPMRAQHPTFVMVPVAESPYTWATTEVIHRSKPASSYPEKLPLVIEALRSLMKTEAIDPARIYVTGQSMGGVGSWGAIAKYPELFAAAVPVCGGWQLTDVPKMVGVPVWAFHGGSDPTVPVQLSRDLTAALTKAGSVVKYTEYPGVGHSSWMKAYDEPELWTWLFAQKKTAGPSVTPLNGAGGVLFKTVASLAISSYGFGFKY